MELTNPNLSHNFHQYIDKYFMLKEGICIRQILKKILVVSHKSFMDTLSKTCFLMKTKILNIQIDSRAIRKFSTLL